MKRGTDGQTASQTDRHVISKSPHIATSPQHLHQNIYLQPVQKNRSAAALFSHI